MVIPASIPVTSAISLGMVISIERQPAGPLARVRVVFPFAAFEFAAYLSLTTRTSTGRSGPPAGRSIGGRIDLGVRDAVTAEEPRKNFEWRAIDFLGLM